MKNDFNPNIPIYLQVIEQIKTQIVAGKLCPGGKIDSVRDLAVAYGANPNTIQRALSELERDGLLKSERTIGRYISDDINLIHQVKDELALKYIQVFIEDMDNLGFSKDEIYSEIKKFSEGEKNEQ